MVSRFGMSKDGGAVGVVVGMGPMHCLMPHCASGPHHLSPQAQNGPMAPPPPAPHSHAHVHTHNHHPPPSASPHGHLNHLNIGAPHQITINFAPHQQHQGQQAQQQQFRIISANATRNEFHIPGQNYGGQGGNQVGGGGSNVGVPGGRGPAGLSGIQPLGQTTTGLGGGGPGGAGQQAPPQPPTQSLQQQGPNQTSTPPGVHTSTAPDMGKQPHLQQAQPNTLPPNSYGQAPTRPVAFYQSGPRPQQQQGIPHRRQGNAGTAVVNMPVGNGQQAGMYPHPHQNIATLPQMNVLLQQGLHPPQHQFGNPIPMQSVNAVPPNIRNYHPQRHQQNPVYYPPLFLTPNQPHPQHYAYYSAHSPAMNLNRTNTSNVSAGTQHSGSPMVSAQASSITQQGPLQSLPPAQTMPLQVVSQIGADLYMPHNGSMMNMHNNAPKNQIVKKESKALKIINPDTLEQVVVDEKEKNSAAQGDGSVSQTSQLENGAEVRAEFAARVAKTLEEPVKESSKEKEVPKVAPEESKKAPELAVEKPKEDEKKESAKAQSPPRRKSPERIKDDERKRDDKPIAAPKIEAAAKPANGEAEKDASESCKADGAQKSADGKASQQKQKSKSKVNRRDLNRRGAEKEGTDMDAFVNAVPAGAKIESADAKPPLVPAKEPSPGQAEEPATLPKEPASAAPPASTLAVEKGLKDRDNHNESKKDKPAELTDETVAEKEVLEKPVKNEVPVENTEENKKVDDEVDHAAVSEMTMSSSVELKSIVEMKNEENAKISERTSAVDQSSAVINEPELPPTTQEEPEPKPVEEPKAQAPPKPTLKYKYTPEMWSPVNLTGQRVYNREFLMNLQNDPQSQRKPTKLPELDVVLKDNKSQSSIGNMRMSNSMGRSDSFFPFNTQSNDRHKSNMMQKTNMPPSKNSSLMRDKNSRGNKPGAKPPMQLSISLKEDVKLKETANAWKPNRMKNANAADEDVKSDRLYKKVRSVLNKLTPDNLKVLVKQVAVLEIDSRERLDGVIKLVFEKAIEEPNFSETYAQFCKEVGSMQVNLQDSQENNAASFKKLIINRCQVMFESHASEENVTTQEIQKELHECKDPEKKKELQVKLEDEKRRIRIKSVGNIRFIGEIFKLGMLTIKIMNMCITHLLDNPNEENLECLCKLLTTIGETLEIKNKQNLSEYFDRMTKISQQKTGKNKISSRIRFMLQDVIELRNRKWVPRRENSNPKTMGEIKQDFINEKKINVFSSLPSTTPRKDDRGDRKRNRPGQCDEGGWTPAVANRTSRQPLNVEPSRLKNKPPSMDDLQLGDRNMFVSMSNKNIQSSGSKLMTTTANKFQILETYQSEDKRIGHTLAGSRSTGPQYRTDYSSKSSYDRSNTRNGSHQMNSGSSSRENNAVYDSTRSQSMTMPPPSMKLAPQTTSAPKAELTSEEINKLVSEVVKKFKSHDDHDVVKAKITEKISDSSATEFVTELVNSSLEKSTPIRKLISTLMCSLMTSGCIKLAHYKAGFLEILSMTSDLEIDIPKVVNYLVEILVHPIAKGIFPLSDLKSFLSSLRESNHCGKFVGLLLNELANEKSPQWVHEKWSQSGLQLSELVGPSVNDFNAFVSEHNLFFITDGKCTSSSTGKQVNLDFVHSQLLKLMKETNYDEIVSWITNNVGDNVKDPKFVRTLMTAILETSIEVTESKSDFLIDKFTELETLIQRFVDTDATLELQCVYAIQAYMYKLKFPQGLILKIFNKLVDDGVISSEAFLQWEKDDQPSEQEGKGMAVKFTTSFFTSLKEIEDDDASDAEDEASEDEAPKTKGSDKDQTSSEQLSAHPSSLSQDCRG